MRLPCDHCGYVGYTGWLRDTDRWLCGLCAHRLAIAKDLALRIARAKRRTAA